MAPSVQSQPIEVPVIDRIIAEEIAAEIYVYTYPLLVMDTTRRKMTIPVGAFGLGPVNQFNHMRIFPKPGFEAVIRPNFDTLYSSAWLDLTREPVVVSTPDTDDRYFILQMLDMWTEVFASPSKRTTGTAPQNYVLVAPGWQEQTPPGITRIEAPTPFVWIIGRIQTNGRDDVKNVRALQDGFVIKTLSNYTGTATPSHIEEEVTTARPPKRAVDKMSADVYFAYASELLRVNPPHVADAPFLERMKRVGFVAGEKFDVTSQPQPLRRAFEEAVFKGQKLMRDNQNQFTKQVNSWHLNNSGLGNYGTNYLQRAIIAKNALGANAPEDAVYPMTSWDAEGQPLDGNNNYVLHFDEAQLPPVNGFWSVTVYKADGFPATNSIDRYAIGDRDSLRYNPDGSLDLYIQKESPGTDQESNWLPVPRQHFNLTMRLYWPMPPVLSGDWAPPPLRRVE
ncbi:MAG: DUF1254 domain-containing protein [Candidatus Hydrogenedentes bacterium]|nr:DUF1254 domain-containing protein [Candidatus Hydrogenedentota bacterium]